MFGYFGAKYTIALYIGEGSFVVRGNATSGGRALHNTVVRGER